MRWLIKDITKVHPTTRRYLLAATPTYKDDYMREAMGRHACFGDYLAVALFSGKNLIGWAMLDFFLSGQCWPPAVRTYIYVKEKYRRNGYGSMILQKAREVAKRRGREIRVCPHDKRSKKFFQAFNITNDQVVRGYSLR
jgi:GNAT superfamily N-acetyltransferase